MSDWQPIETAPKDGETIIGDYGDGEECKIFWSDRPVCMLGSRCGGFPEGWATDGSETDYNLPMDEPERWKADFDFIARDKTITKIKEGGYNE